MSHATAALLCIYTTPLYIYNVVYIQPKQGPFQSVGLAAVAKFWGAGTAVLTRRCPLAAWLQSSPPWVTRGSRLNSLKPQLASGPRLCHPSQGKASDRCTNSSCGLFRKAQLGEGQGRQAVVLSGQRAAISLPYDAGIGVIHAPGDSASPVEKQLSSIAAPGSKEAPSSSQHFLHSLSGDVWRWGFSSKLGWCFLAFLSLKEQQTSLGLPKMGWVMSCCPRFPFSAHCRLSLAFSCCA